MTTTQLQTRINELEANLAQPGHHPTEIEVTLRAAPVLLCI